MHDGRRHDGSGDPRPAVVPGRGDTGGARTDGPPGTDAARLLHPHPRAGDGDRPARGGRDRERAGRRPARRRPGRGQGPHLHEGGQDGLRLPGVRGLRARRGRRRRRTAEGRRRRDPRKDQRAGVRLQRRGAQPGLPRDPQPVGPRAHSGWVQRRLRRRRRRWHGPAGAGERRWRVHPDPEQLLRPLRHQGVHGPRAPLPGDQGRAPPGRVQLGVAGAHRPDDPDRRRQRAAHVGDRRPRSA